MEMDTSIGVACSMVWEWEAAAIGEQLDAWTIGGPQAQSSGREYPGCNNLELWVTFKFPRATESRQVEGMESHRFLRSVGYIGQRRLGQVEEGCKWF